MSIVLPSDELVSSSWDRQRTKKISLTADFVSEHCRLSNEMQKHMDTAHCQYSHYINVLLGLNKCHDVLLEVYVL